MANKCDGARSPTPLPNQNSNNCFCWIRAKRAQSQDNRLNTVWSAHKKETQLNWKLNLHVLRYSTQHVATHKTGTTRYNSSNRLVHTQQKGKGRHSLRERDVDHKDKQNFNAVLNIIRAAPLLQKLPDALATKHYVEVMQCVVDSYLNKAISPIERIEKNMVCYFFCPLLAPVDFTTSFIYSPRQPYYTQCLHVHWT